MTLTNGDLKAIKDLMEITIEDKTEHFVTKMDISHLPTKDEFYEETDKLMKELKDMREEQKVLTTKVYRDHEPRIKKVEKKLQIHSSV